LPSRKLKVTLALSPIGRKPNHVRTIEALGLRRIRATVVHEDTPIIRGMIAQVAYALRVEAVDDAAAAGSGRRAQKTKERSV
jgi:large subunit ribosomal protein L30